MNSKIKKSMFVYTEYLSQINDRNEFNSRDLSLIATNSEAEPDSYKFTNLLEEINSKVVNEKEHWDITSDSDDICTNEVSASSHDEFYNYHPKNCWPTNKFWVKQNSDLNIRTNNILDAIKTLVELANSDTQTNSIKNLLENNLKGRYITFLQEEIDILSTFITRIQELTKIVSKFSGKNEKVFNFANCGFIKTNIQVLIKNLKDAFGNDLYTIGVFFY